MPRLILLAAGLCACLGGSWLIGVAAFGAMLLVIGLGAAVVALLSDDGAARPVPKDAPTLHDILERARRAG